MLHAQSRLRCEVDDGKLLHQRFHQENAEHQKTVSGVMVYKQNVLLKKCVTRSCCDLTH